LSSGTAEEPRYSDAAKRASDIINSYRAFIPWDELKQKWLAIRLSDGGYDGVLYDSKRDAVRHQLDEFLCAYICFRNLVGGATPKEMEIFLKFNRDAYDAGFRLPDPDAASGGAEVLMTTAQHDYLAEQQRIVQFRRWIASQQ
jgi:hypothetical protein